MLSKLEETIKEEQFRDLQKFAEYLGVDFEDYLEFLHPDVDFDDYSRWLWIIMKWMGTSVQMDFGLLYLMAKNTSPFIMENKYAFTTR